MHMVRPFRRIFAALALAAAPFAVQAQGFPAKPIRIIVPFGPGGVADIVARSIAPKMAEGLGQAVVIENKPSAGGILAAETVAHAEPDGHTLLLISNGNAVSSALFKSLPYDAANDFAMISTIGYFGLAIVTDAASPYQSLKDLVAAAKASPGKLNFATIGIGSTQHLSAELFRARAGIDVQVINYKASGEVLAAVKSHQVQAGFEILTPVLGQLRSGALRALAVTTAKRYPGLPQVPTAIESGIADYDVASWNGLAAPAKTPRAVIERLAQETAKAVAAPEVQKRLSELGVEPRASTPAELREFFVSESKRWGKVVEGAKIPKQ
jgi:tripartite-type tricarboxylate transporter receptor subunit TctC